MEESKLVVTMKTITCQKGHFYTIPCWANYYRCPMCAQDDMGEANRMKLNLIDKNVHLCRVINGLRGENTRLRSRI